MAKEWTTIKIPKQVLPLVRELRERTGKASWAIILEALSFYKSALSSSKHFSTASDLDKISYYVMKLVTSATYFKIQKSEESLAKFRNVIEQVEKRLGIECGELRASAEKLLQKKVTGKDIHTFNMSIKMCIIKLLEKLLA